MNNFNLEVSISEDGLIEVFFDSFGIRIIFVFIIDNRNFISFNVIGYCFSF